MLSFFKKKWKTKSVVHAEQLKDASDAFKQHNYSEALRIWKSLADQGVDEAQYNLGASYSLKDRGVRPGISQYPYPSSDRHLSEPQ